MFDFIVAWDCLFRLPPDEQEPVLSKLCHRLSEGGVLIYSIGDDEGEHSAQWRGQEFRYSSIGISQNMAVLQDNGMSMLHLEIDPFPEKQVYAIAQKPSPLSGST